MRKILSEKNIAGLLFVMVIVAFSFAHEDSKKRSLNYNVSTHSVSSENPSSLSANTQKKSDIILVKGKETEFATVIVFLREGHGGFMFIHNEKTKQQFTIKERMLLEVAKSIEIAYELCNLFTVYDVDMEVHADINTNPHFKSNDALKEAMGYILGMGFAFKAKPEAFASSSCANKVVN